MEEDDISPVVKEEISQVLTTVVPVIWQIFEYLNVFDLNRCAQVCKMWNQIACSIKKTRTQMFWMFKVVLLNDRWGNPEDYQDDLYPEFDDTSPLSKSCFEVGLHFYEVLRKAPSEPSVVFIFGTEGFFKHPRRYFPDYDSIAPVIKRNELTVGDQWQQPDQYDCETVRGEAFLAHHLPKQCKMVAVVHSYDNRGGYDGVVGTSVNKLKPMAFPYYLWLSDMEGFTALFLPSIPGFDSYQFCLTEEEVTQVMTSSHENAGYELYKLTGIPLDEEVKCLIFFQRSPSSTDASKMLIDYLAAKQTGNIAIGGSRVRSFWTVGQDKNASSMLTGIAFCGRGVRAASITLTSDIYLRLDTERAYSKLQVLKQCMIPGNNTIAFMFENAHWDNLRRFGRDRLDVLAFLRAFPAVPLFGLFTGGMGNSYLPKTNGDVEKSTFQWNKYMGEAVYILLHIPIPRVNI